MQGLMSTKHKSLPPMTFKTLTKLTEKRDGPELPETQLLLFYSLLQFICVRAEFSLLVGSRPTGASDLSCLFICEDMSGTDAMRLLLKMKLHQ